MIIRQNADFYKRFVNFYCDKKVGGKMKLWLQNTKPRAIMTSVSDAGSI